MELKSDNPALYVHGIGFIDQYGAYVNCLWEKGVVYFVRDYYYQEVQRVCEQGGCARALVARLDALNSDIAVYERHGSGQCCSARQIVG